MSAAYRLSATAGLVVLLLVSCANTGCNEDSGFRDEPFACRPDDRTCVEGFVCHPGLLRCVPQAELDARVGGEFIPPRTLQRFGSALQLTPHFHTIGCDGVFSVPAGAERARLHALSSPTNRDVEALVERVHERVHPGDTFDIAHTADAGLSRVTLSATDLAGHVIEGDRGAVIAREYLAPGAPLQEAIVLRLDGERREVLIRGIRSELDPLVVSKLRERYSPDMWLRNEPGCTLMINELTYGASFAELTTTSSGLHLRYVLPDIDVGFGGDCDGRSVRISSGVYATKGKGRETKAMEHSRALG